jgi:predicted transcriptional regulator
MQETTVVTVRLPIETAQRLTALAEATKRSKSYLSAEAIEEYLTLHEWQIQAIQQGIREADAGKLIPQETVMEWVESWGTDQEKDVPRCD